MHRDAFLTGEQITRAHAPPQTIPFILHDVQHGGSLLAYNCPTSSAGTLTPPYFIVVVAHTRASAPMTLSTRPLHHGSTTNPVRMVRRRRHEHETPAAHVSHAIASG